MYFVFSLYMRLVEIETVIIIAHSLVYVVKSKFIL